MPNDGTLKFSTKLDNSEFEKGYLSINKTVSETLAHINEKSAKVSEELKKVNELLRLDPQNMELLTQQQTLFAEKTALSAEKLELLKSIQGDVNAAFSNQGNYENAYKPLIEQTKELEKQLKELEAKKNEFDSLLSKSGLSYNQYEYLEKSISDTKTKLKELQKEKAQTDEKFSRSKVSYDEYKQLNTSITEAKKKLNELKVVKKSLDENMQDKNTDTYKSLRLSIDKAKTELAELREKKKLADESFKENEVSVKAYEKLNRAIEKTGNELSELASEKKKTDKAFAKSDVNIKEYKALQQNITSVENSLEDLAEQKQAVDKEFEGKHLNSEELREYQREIIDTENGLKSAQNAARNFGNESENAAEKANTGFSKVGPTVAKIGAALAAASATALAGLSAAAVNVGSSFEAEMSKVEAISGAAGEDLEALTDKAKEMGAKTKFSASESATALNYMAMAGWKTEQMLSGLPGVMDLAAASGEDLATVSDIVTDAMTAFGMQAEESGHFADVLASASSSANTNVSLMGQTFKYVAPVAGAMKYSIEDTALAIGILANAGIKGEHAGTQLRAVLARLVNPPKEAAQAIESLGIEVANANGSMKPLNETLSILRASFSELTDSEKTAYASMLAGQEAMSGLLTLVNASEEDYNKLADAIANADGSAGAMSDTMNDNLRGSFIILQSALEGLGISVFDKFSAPLKNAVEEAITDINSLNGSINNGKLGESIDKIADAFAEMAGNIAEFAADKGIPALVDTFTWLIDNGPTVKAVIGGIVTGIAAFKITNSKAFESIIKSWQEAKLQLALFEATQSKTAIATEALNGKLKLSEIAYAGLTGKINLATAATTSIKTALKKAETALNAVPLGAIISLLTITATAFANVCTAAFATSNKLKDLKKDLNDLKESMEDNKIETEAQVEYVKRLNFSYEDLRTNVNRTAKEEELLKQKALELQSILPEGTKILDEKTGAYCDLSDSVSNYVYNLRAQTEAEAESQIYKEQISQIVKLRKTIAEEESKGIADMKYGVLSIWDNKSSLAEAKKQLEDLEKATSKYENKLNASTKETNDELLKETEEYNKTKYTVIEDAYTKQHKLDMAYQRTAILENVKTFEEGKEELDRARKRSLITDSQYYDELENLLKEHNMEDIGEYQAYYDELISGRKQLNDTLLQEQENANKKLEQEQEKSLKEQQSLQEKEFKNWTDNANKAVDEYNKKCSSIISQRETLQNKLASFGSLFTIEKDEETDNEIVRLEDLKKQTQDLIYYSEQLNKLREQGASSDFLSEVSGMDISEASKFMDALFDSGSIDEYLKAYEEKQEQARKIAEESCKNQLETLQTEFVDKTQDILNTIPENMSLIGENTVQGFIEEIQNRLSDISDAGMLMGNTFLDSLKKSLDIHSPSKATGKLADFAGQGFILALEKYKKQAYEAAEGISGNLQKGLNSNVQDIAKQIQSVRNMELAMSLKSNYTPQTSVSNVIPSSTDNSSHTYHVTIDAHNVRDFVDVVNVCKNAQQKARAR